MFIAELDTGHFSFTSLGETRAQALDAMHKGWDAHVKQAPASERGHMFKWDELAEDVNVAEIPVGGCLRDLDYLLVGRGEERVAGGVQGVAGAPGKIAGLGSWYYVSGILIVDTEFDCLGCAQKITAVRPVPGKWYTECGGEGEGGCEHTYGDGEDEVVLASHQTVIDAVKKAEEEGL